MKKYYKAVTFLCIMLFTTTVFSQTRALVMTNTQTHKVKVIKEHKRIKLKTVSGYKKVGKFEIVDASRIKIRGHFFKLSDIQMIKKYPLGISIITKIVAIGGGLAIATTGVYAPQGIEVLLFITGGFVAYVGSEAPNLFNKAYQRKMDWQFAIHF